MALTFTETGLETAFDAVQTAKDARDFEAAYSALVDAELIYQRIFPTSASANGVAENWRASLDAMAKLLDRLRALQSSTAKGRKRFVRVGVAHRG